MKTISRLFLVGLAAVTTAVAWGAASSAVPHLRPGTELMVDDARIFRKENIVRRVHAASKPANLVLEATRPWEESRVYVYGSVHCDPVTGKFRMWYTAPGRVLYAESDDGLIWRKPELDVVDWEGRKTNIVIPVSYGASVLVDSAEPDPEKRYKALIAEPIKRGGFAGHYSADGIHWKRYGEERIFPDGSEMGHLTRDPATGKYLAYIRPYPPRHFPKNVNEKRLGAMVTSDDFVHWSPMKMTLVPDAIDDAWVTKPAQRTEFYAMNGFAYGNSYLGVIPLFRVTGIHEKALKEQSRYDGPMEGQLIASRDGVKWDRLAERDPVIPSGPVFDQSIMNVATEPIVVRDEIWHYYTAINTTHGGPMPPKRIGIALAKWRLDGFVSLDAGDVEGVIETTTLPAAGVYLEINAKAAAGRVIVEVLDASGNVLDGYRAEEGEPFNDDQVRHVVRWKHRETLPTNREYRLRFRLKNASLFSYTLKQEARPANSASVATPKTGNAAFFEKHAAFLARAKAGPMGVLFLGDSITEGWKKEPHIWDAYFGQYQPANFGIGGDQTQHVLWRLENGELEGINPKAVVLLIGTNNSGRHSGEQIAAAVQKIVETIRTKLPQSKVLLLAIFPRGPRNGPDKKPEPWEKRLATIAAANARLATFDDGRMVRFLDINRVFLSHDGTIPASIMPDQLHLSPAGYQLWADAIAQPLSEMMK